MNFPSFGDAEGFAAAGQACSAALLGQGGTIFDACYLPLRPRASILLVALPYLVTGDPVHAAYVQLLTNLLFVAAIAGALFSMLAEDSSLFPSWPNRSRFLAWAVVLTLLPNLVSLVPVPLGDLPSLAAFTMAVKVGSGILTRPPAESPARRYALCGLWAAAAALLKVTYFLYGAMFGALLLLLDRQPRRDRERLACGLAFLGGLSPVLLQFLDVYLHSGHFWLYDPDAMRVFFHPRRGQAIEAAFFTIPQIGAYSVKPVVPLGFLSLVAMRLFRGLFGFEWAVYHGRAPRGEWWTLSASDLALAWILVLLFFAFVAVVLARAPRSLRALNAAAAAVAVTTALFAHTELRYYAFPRSALWVTLACGAAGLAQRLRARAPRGAQ